MQAKSDQMESLIAKISSIAAGNAMKDDVKRNIRALIQNSFSKMDLVTREEFETQRAILARTREKVDALERQLNALTNK